MDSLKDPLTQIKLMKCPRHHLENTNLIDLSGFSKYGRFCKICSEEYNISEEYLLRIEEIFEKEEGKFLSKYPFFINGDLKKKIKKLFNEKISIEKIDKFFEKLREDVETIIKEAQKKTKLYFIQYENIQSKVYLELKKIEEIELFKKLIVDGGDKLVSFINEKWKNVKQYEKAIQKVIPSEQNFLDINIEKKNQEISKLLLSFSRFNLFDVNCSKSILQNTNLVKSTYFTSSQLTINKTSDNYLQLINNNLIQIRGQAYLDFILNPYKRYSILLNFKSKKGSIFFGLISDEMKNQNWNQYVEKLYFQNQFNHSNGITRQIKNTEIGKVINNSFEVRILICQQILKFGSFPTYSSAFEIYDKNLIIREAPNRFFVQLEDPKDFIEITEIVELDKFDDEF